MLDDAMSGETNESLLREALVGMAKLSEQVGALNSRVSDAARDAREARDAAREFASASTAQDIPAKIAELKGMIDQISSAARTDLVNTSARLTTEFRDNHAMSQRRLDGHETRIGQLEADKQRRDGITGVAAWVSKNMPWLLPALAFAAAFFGFKGSSHG